MDLKNITMADLKEKLETIDKKILIDIFFSNKKSD